MQLYFSLINNNIIVRSRRIRLNIRNSCVITNRYSLVVRCPPGHRKQPEDISKDKDPPLIR